MTRDDRAGALQAIGGASTLILLFLLAPPAVTDPASPGAPGAGGTPRDTVPTVEPGRIATVPVALPADARNPLPYRIRPRPGVRLLGDTTGLSRPVDGRHVIPLTVQVPASREAGSWVLATVVLDTPGDDDRRRRVRVRVAEERGLELQARVSAARAPPGGVLRVPFRLQNTGNVQDSVRLRARARGERWQIAHPAGDRVLGPGERWRDTARVQVPTRMDEGVAERVELRASASSGSTAGAHVVLRATSRAAGPFPGMERLPASLFLSTSRIQLDGSGAAPDVVGSLDASGRIGGGMRLDLFARRRPNPEAPDGVRPFLTGPTARAALSGDGWEVAAGDVYGDRGPIAGVAFNGRGVRGRWNRAGWDGGLLLTAPAGGPAFVRDGHRITGFLDRETPRGTVGLSAAWKEERLLPGRPLFGVRSAGLRYETRSGPAGSHLQLGGGWMQLTRGDSVTAQGPSAEATLRIGGESGEAWARASRVPGLWPTAGFRGDQLRIGGRYRAATDLHVLGRVFYAHSPLLGAPGERARRGVDAGTEVDAAGGELRFAAGVRQERDDASGGWRDLQALDLGASLPLGPFSWTARIETEQRIDGTDRADGWHLRFLRSGLQYSRDDLRARLTVHALDAFRDAGPGRSPWRYSLRGTWRGDALGLRWRVRSAGSPADAGDRWSGWVRLRRDVTDRTAVVATLERDVGVRAASDLTLPADASDDGGWSATLGVQVDLDLPLPIPRHHDVRGTVFLDRNGNLRRDPGERGVPSVTLQKGWARVETDSSGGFSVGERSVAERPLRLEPASLPSGLVLPPSVDLPRSGSVEIPLVRPARLELRLFRDQNGNGRREETEPALSGASVDLSSPEGRDRDYRRSSGEEGSATFGAVLPGRYRLTVRVPGTTFRGPVEMERSLRLSPGSERTVALPVPAGRDGVP